MMRIMVSCAIMSLMLSACEPKQEATTGWAYTHGTDKLRRSAVVVARLGSNETDDGTPQGKPILKMKVVEGSTNDEVVITGDGRDCGTETLIRIDDHPIENLPCRDDLGFLVQIPADSELGKRIVASSEVVIEMSGPFSRQASFTTAGLDLSQGRAASGEPQTR